jgi:hypothetical protein
MLIEWILAVLRAAFGGPVTADSGEGDDPTDRD